MIKQSVYAISLLFLSLSLSVLAEPELLNSQQLVSQLQQGGYIIYFRHAATDKSSLDVRPIDLSRCEGQRNLSAQGRNDARRIGGALRRLGIETARVMSSPYCRCQETARLAFGDYQVDDRLRFAISLDLQKRRIATGYLVQLLGTMPAPGVNHVVVSHSSNLKEATGVWPEFEGGAYVFMADPLRPGEVVFKGYIRPSEWDELSKG